MIRLMPDPLGRAIVLRSTGRSLRRSFDSIAVAGHLPRGGAVLAANHGSWWDGYLLGGLAGAVGQRSAIMMTSQRLAAFPFLRLAGAVGTDGARDLVRAAVAGRWAVVFPEGDLQPGRTVAPLHPGAAWVARTARVPLVPVAVRVVTRGAPLPDALVRFGEPIDAGAQDVRATTTVLAARLQDEVDRLEADVAVADPDLPVPGYRVARRGTSIRRDTVSWSVRALAWLTGRPSRPSRPLPAGDDRGPR